MSERTEHQLAGCRIQGHLWSDGSIHVDGSDFKTADQAARFLVDRFNVGLAPATELVADLGPINPEEYTRRNHHQRRR